jgi:hypothetical protein
MLKMVKIRFENSTKTYDFCLSDYDSAEFTEQQKTFLENLDYESYEFRKMHHLFNTETHMFILNSSELISGNEFLKI